MTTAVESIIDWTIPLTLLCITTIVATYTVGLFVDFVKRLMKRRD